MNFMNSHILRIFCDAEYGTCHGTCYFKLILKNIVEEGFSFKIFYLQKKYAKEKWFDGKPQFDVTKLKLRVG